MELQIIQNKIYEIRGQKVMLDFDLAELYATETRLLKRAVRRNIDRFPIDCLNSRQKRLTLCYPVGYPKMGHPSITSVLTSRLLLPNRV